MNIQRLIAKYSKNAQIKRDLGVDFNPKTGKANPKNSDLIDIKIAIFKKSNHDIIKTKEGNRLEYDVKFFSNIKLICDDKDDKIADIVIIEDKSYELIAVDKKDELKDIFWIGFGVLIV